MIAILNSLRAQKGKRPLGFLNYWFYQSGRWGFKEYVSFIPAPNSQQHDSC